MRELFIEELEEVQGGKRPPFPHCQCCFVTTLACCEEAPPCDSCCPIE